MLKTIRLSLLFIIMTLGSSIQVSATTHYIEFSGVNIDYELPPHDPQEFVNRLFWSITSTCIIHTQEPTVDVLIEVLKKSGKINGTTIPEGSKIILSVYEGYTVVVSADSGSIVRITNNGMSPILANCVS